LENPFHVVLFAPFFSLSSFYYYRIHVSRFGRDLSVRRMRLPARGIAALRLLFRIAGAWRA